MVTQPLSHHATAPVASSVLEPAPQPSTPSHSHVSSPGSSRPISPGSASDAPSRDSSRDDSVAAWAVPALIVARALLRNAVLMRYYRATELVTKTGIFAASVFALVATRSVASAFSSSSSTTTTTTTSPSSPSPAPCVALLRNWLLVNLLIGILHSALLVRRRLPYFASRLSNVQKVRLDNWMFLLAAAWSVWTCIGLVFTFAFASACARSQTVLYATVTAASLVLIVLSASITGVRYVQVLLPMAQGIRLAAAMQHGDAQLTPATAEERDALPKLQWEEGIMPKEDATCPICLTAYVEGEALTKLPCVPEDMEAGEARHGHYFHRDCVLTWLKTHRVCPICRTDVNPLRQGEAV